MLPDEPFRCVALAAVLRGRVCVARQLEVERELQPGTSPSARAEKRPRRAEAGRTLEALARHMGKRGIGVEFASCHQCPQGRAIRRLLGDAVAAGVRSGRRRGEDGLTALLAMRTAEREHPPGEPMIIDHLG